jgi:hypothetical protein
VLRRAFRKDVDLEKVWEENVESEFRKPSVGALGDERTFLQAELVQLT